MSDKQETSYKGILKSTSIIGGAQVFQILVSIVRTKIVAILLGTAGIGLTGLYMSVFDLVRSMSSLGINMSGVRDVAEAQKDGDKESIAKTVVVLKRWSWTTGILGTLILLFFCVPFSQYSFGNKSHALNLAVLSIGILISSISAYQITIIQGMQLYKKIAQANIAAAIASLIIALPLFYFLKFDGIIPSLIISPIIALLINLWLIRKLVFVPVKISYKETFTKGFKMVKLGTFMTINGLIATVSMLLIRSYLSKKGGIEAVGLFQASWMISTMYIGIVLNAMLTDFFPRMSANSKDNHMMNRLTNEQCEITLILGAPLLMVLMSLTPVIVTLLYSDAFKGSVVLLQWLIAGSFLVLISWPVGVIFISKGMGLYSVLLDFTGSLCLIILGVVAWRYFGIVGFGIAAFIRAMFSIFLVLILGKKASGFKFNISYLKLMVLFTTLFMCCFVFTLLKINYISNITNIFLTVIVFLISFKMLCKRVDVSAIFRKFIEAKK